MIRRSLRALVDYAQSDDAMRESTFPGQVCELSWNLHQILLDTVKMQEFQDVCYFRVIAIFHSLVIFVGS